MSWYEIKAKAEDKAEVWIYDVIGEDFWGEGVAAKKFVKDLAALKVDQIDIRLNSPGGSVWDGNAIYNAIVRHPANVTTYVDGLAASIASVIALAGNQVVMAENSLMMIHNPWAMVVGTAKEMREGADMLDKVGETILGVYEKKTGNDASIIALDMDAETWFTADEAVAYGLADLIEDGLQAAALAVDQKIMARYKNAPQELLTPVSTTTTNTTTFSTGAVEDTSDGASQIEDEISKPIDFEFEKIRLRR